MNSMKHIFWGIALLLTQIITAQKWSTPRIESYGKIHFDKNLSFQPDINKTYKLVFNIDNDAEKEGVNMRLWKIARELNLLKAAGVPDQNIEIAAVVHGKAIAISLTDKAYKKRYHKKNPNTDLVKALNNAGVKLYLCEQTLAGMNFEESELNPSWEVTLSALLTLPILESEGYFMVP
tara:strand:- start:315 stop:848 length:534 start_codon:yes stop_codon:yes gene_type:complete